MTALPRRHLLAAAGTVVGGSLIGPPGLLRTARAQPQAPAPGAPLDAALQDAIRDWCAGTVPREGRVTLDVAPLVDNGNTVPVTVRVVSPMTPEDHVRDIALFNERNPQRDVLRCQLTPACGRAEVASRIRLATSQHLVALARLSDGSIWQHTVEVVVTLAACLED